MVEVVSLSPGLSVIGTLAYSFSLLYGGSSIRGHVTYKDSVPIPVEGPLFGIDHIVPVGKWQSSIHGGISSTFQTVWFISSVLRPVPIEA